MNEWTEGQWREWLAENAAAEYTRDDAPDMATYSDWSFFVTSLPTRMPQMFVYDLVDWKPSLKPLKWLMQDILSVRRVWWAERAARLTHITDEGTALIQAFQGIIKGQV